MMMMNYFTLRSYSNNLANFKTTNINAGKFPILPKSDFGHCIIDNAGKKNKSVECF